MGTPAIFETPKIKVINRDYIAGLTSLTQADIKAGNFDSSITKSRSMIEEVFIYVIKKHGIIPTIVSILENYIHKLKAFIKMHTDKNIDLRINMLLPELEKILTAITEMRNESNDLHGVGGKE